MTRNLDISVLKKYGLYFSSSFQDILFVFTRACLFLCNGTKTPYQAADNKTMIKAGTFGAPEQRKLSGRPNGRVLYE